MSADPALDRIAASVENSLLYASPAAQEFFGNTTDRFITAQLKVFDGDPAELGAVFLNMYREICALANPLSAGVLAPSLGPEQILTGLQFYLAHGGVQLYLRRHPAAQLR
ncbi:hypothetical protein KGQ20_04275 [Catenulispora sp. NF23]|uniref:PAS domain-containing protein n=1 Tax=Catenulispora pinistramenti TaxID=2705254 RepID=A0ABS5L0P1_9ACTN|nr:hypothetical protein [Catenulispora pinistramenti]MBS2531980.1 hypothetical protein [Catenulispora pinistramenti]MBS2551824.1 hypothetical protein [Catenulispora pinistramenti]